MLSLAKQSRRKMRFLRGTSLGDVLGRLASAFDGGGRFRDPSLESCMEYLEYLENIDIDGKEPVEGPPTPGQKQKMLFDELS